MLDLNALGIEASKSDGRLARRSLRNIESEIQAHRILLSQFTRMIQDNEYAIKVKPHSRFHPNRETF